MSETTTIIEESVGGLGGSASKLKQSDMRMIQRAIRNDWPIRAELRERLVEEMATILQDPNEMSRDKISAAKALLTADSLNAKREASDIAADKDESSTTINIDNRRVIVLPRNGRESSALAED